MSVEDIYHRAMHDILLKVPVKPKEGGPTRLTDHLYIGGYKEADDIATLTQLRITHVLNCAAYRKCDKNPYPESSGITHYKQFHADDRHDYDILDKHFEEAKDFIDGAKKSGGKCLVHCAVGINRSGVICTAYVMIYHQLPVLDAVKFVKSKKGRILANQGFQRQLIRYARQCNLLD